MWLQLGAGFGAGAAGASLGSHAGPYGAGVGGFVGFIAGILGYKQAKENAEVQLKETKAFARNVVVHEASLFRNELLTRLGDFQEKSLQKMDETCYKVIRAIGAGVFTPLGMLLRSSAPSNPMASFNSFAQNLASSAS